ncbi:hypothetical protein SLS53_001095 [Cytospora paraplurivora]|uniref:Uncharacterized protein n=1 Tax=Cytospora paraplurivora TaxID=2898453 RepID=A0AAN9YKS5_9PEZI
MKFPMSPVTAFAVLYGFKFANAICAGTTGSDYAIGTPDALSTGYTQYDIYDTSCNVVHSLQIVTSYGVCDSDYFICTSGTKTIGGYDDPTTGEAYICVSDTTSEACANDTVTFCCYPGYSSPE